MSSKKIYISIGVLLSAIILFVGLMCVEINSDKIAKNIHINEINVGGLSKKEAISKLNEAFNIKEFTVSSEDKKWSIDTSKIDLEYKIDETVEKAYLINKNGSFFENISKTIELSFGEQDNVDLQISYDEESLKKELEIISKDINIDKKDATLDISSSEIKVNEHVDGQMVDIKSSMGNIEKAIMEGNNSEKLVVSTDESKIKTEDLSKVDTLLSTYSTTFTAHASGRNDNIRLATQKSSDVLLMPGDVYSYNEHTGMRTVENGYKNAPVIVNGSLQDGIGGGVCQVSSTLYNTVLFAGLEIVNIRNHSIPSDYVPMGRDATVTDSGIDFVFKNSLDYPVYIKNYVSGNKVTCQIYGSSDDKQNIKLYTTTDGVSNANVRKVEDDSLLVGEEKIIEKGRNAYTISTFRVFKDDNGNVLNEEKIATSYYPKKEQVVAVGTKVEEVEPEEETSQPEDPNTENPDQPTGPEEPQDKPEEENNNGSEENIEGQ